jgi:hypothetical protein
VDDELPARRMVSRTAAKLSAGQILVQRLDRQTT